VGWKWKFKGENINTEDGGENLEGTEEDGEGSFLPPSGQVVAALLWMTA
jgi:hypothetical protein